MSYRRTIFKTSSAAKLAAFLNRMKRGNEQSASQLYSMTAAELIAASRREERLSGFLLEYERQIVAGIAVEDLSKESRVASFAIVEVDPHHQAAFWKHLGRPLMRVYCSGSFTRLETRPTVWRGRGAALLGRCGFRIVPGSSASMVNYLPLVLKHPATKGFFGSCDFLDGLQAQGGCRRAFSSQQNVKSVSYAWVAPGERLEAHVDSERHQIVLVDRADWTICCHTASEYPFGIRCQIKNKTNRPENVRIQRTGGRNPGRSRTHVLLPGRSAEEEMFVYAGQADPSSGSNEEATVVVEIGDEEFPFVLRRFRMDGEGRSIADPKRLSPVDVHRQRAVPMAR